MGHTPEQVSTVVSPSQRWVPHSLVKPVMVSHLLPRAAIWLQECWSLEGRVVVWHVDLEKNLVSTGPCCWFPLHPSRPPGCGSRQLCVLNRPTSGSMWSNLQDPRPENQLQTFAPVAAKKKAAEQRESEVQKFTAEPFQEEPHHGSMDRHLWIIPSLANDHPNSLMVLDHHCHPMLHQFPSVLMNWMPIPSIYHFQTHPTIISCLIPIRQTHKNHTKYAYIYIYIYIYTYVMYVYVYMLCMPLYLLRISSDLSVQHIFDRLKSPEIWNHHKSP